MTGQETQPLNATRDIDARSALQGERRVGQFEFNWFPGMKQDLWQRSLVFTACHTNCKGFRELLCLVAAPPRLTSHPFS